MSDDKHPDEEKPNPLLSMAFGLFDAVVPGALKDPERALRELVPKLRFLVVASVAKPTLAQLEAIRTLDASKSLVQIRKAIQAGDLTFGPFPGDHAEGGLNPLLAHSGLSVTLRELTAEERARQSESLDNPPPYFRNSDEQD